jgi:hypothetical protein
VPLQPVAKLVILATPPVVEKLSMKSLLEQANENAGWQYCADEMLANAKRKALKRSIRFIILDTCLNN